MTDKRPDFTPDSIKSKPVRDVAELPDGGAGFEGCAVAAEGARPSFEDLLDLFENPNLAEWTTPKTDGWGLFENERGFGIERDDEANRFADDLGAYAYVQGRADLGDEYARLVLAIHHLGDRPRAHEAPSQTDNTPWTPAANGGGVYYFEGDELCYAPRNGDNTIDWAGGGSVDFFSIDEDVALEARRAEKVLRERKKGDLAELEEHIRELKTFAAKRVGGPVEDDDDRGPEPQEFTETAEGDRARERWARRYDELNGAPEDDGDR